MYELNNKGKQSIDTSKEREEDDWQLMPLHYMRFTYLALATLLGAGAVVNIVYAAQTRSASHLVESVGFALMAYVAYRVTVFVAKKINQRNDDSNGPGGSIGGSIGGNCTEANQTNEDTLMCDGSSVSAKCDAFVALVKREACDLGNEIASAANKAVDRLAQAMFGGATQSQSAFAFATTMQEGGAWGRTGGAWGCTGGAWGIVEGGAWGCTGGAWG